MNLKTIKPGENPPHDVNVVIEIPEGCLVKYEFDKKMGAIVVDRFVRTTMGYPANYGFVPNTLSGDGDPVDVIVLCSQPIHPGVVVNAKPVGLLEMEDESGVDAKVIAVPSEKADPFWGHIDDIDAVPTAVKEKIKHFFEYYKKLEPGKWVKIKDWKGKDAATKEITDGINNSK